MSDPILVGRFNGLLDFGLEGGEKKALSLLKKLVF